MSLSTGRKKAGMDGVAKSLPIFGHGARQIDISDVCYALSAVMLVRILRKTALRTVLQFVP